MSLKPFIFFFLIVVLISLSACSRNMDSVSPSVPTSAANQMNSLPTGVTDRSSDGIPIGGMGALGLFQFQIDPSASTAEMVSMRTSALTDVLEVVDITNFLQLAPCTNCVKIKSVSTDIDGNLVLSIGIRHPFGVGDPYKPPTGRNRADLHVFNVEGIVVSNNTGIAFPGIGQTVANFKLLNADGYTGYLDTVLDEIFPTDATIHPYILHFDDYSSGNYNPANPTGFDSVTDPPPTGNLVMAMGCDYNFQDYVFQIESTESINLIYAVGCTYGLSAATKAQRFVPEYRIPQYNKKAASEIHLEMVSNDLKGGNVSSTAQIQIKVVDINQGVPVGIALNEMLADSSVGAITVEIPGVMLSALNVDISSPTGSGHSSSDPLIFPATITNNAGAPEGSYTGLIKVLDTYNPGQNASPLLNGKDGIKRVDPLLSPPTGIFDISEFATYQLFSIDISESNVPPVAILAPDPAETSQHQSIDFDATASNDPDGTITLYEFDFDWDGVEANFIADASNATGLATSSSYNTMGSFTAGLRVTDDMGAMDYDSVPVTVTECGDTIASWNMALPNMTQGRYYASGVQIDNQLWIIGGDGMTSVEVFNLDSETWDATPHAPLPVWQSAFGCAYYNGKIHCIGGFSTSSYSNLHSVYDIASNTWDTTTHPILPGVPRAVLRAVTHQDKIYVCYGYNWQYIGQLNRLDIYDPISKTWSAGANPPYERSAPVWTVVGDKIYAMGNNNPSDTGANKIEYYDVASNTWTSLSVSMNRWKGGPAFATIGTQIYTAGGHEHTAEAYNWVDVFDTVSETWVQEMDLPEDRGFSPIAAYYDCVLYVSAGRGDNYVNLTSIRAAEFD